MRSSQVIFRFFLILGLYGTYGQAQESPLNIVSSASYYPEGSPNSLVTIFGKNLARSVVSAELDPDGQFPVSLDGTSVRIDGKDARIVFISPAQINVLIPSDVALGNHTVQVTSPAISEPLTGSLKVTQVAPGIFTIPCLRPDRGAVLNGVTYALEPFSAVTFQNGSDDKRTRLSVFGTGIRYAGISPGAESQNVSGTVSVDLIDRWGAAHPLTVEYAGPAPVYFGLDQINVVIPADLEGAGLVQLQLNVGEKKSNKTSIVLSKTLAAGLGASYDFGLRTIAGTGVAGNTGDGGAAISAQLQAPVSVAIDRQHNIYFASTTSSVVRRISTSGVITTVAGTGTAGFSGDNGPASSAQLNQPSGVAVDRAGNLYIADTGNHRIRRVDPSGVITTIAGNGSTGFGGDNGPANIAQLSSPIGLAVNSNGTLYIADSGNHRIRRITSDGWIHTFAGSGVSGNSGDGNSAFLARLNSPDGVALGDDGTVWIADSGNRRIRQVAPNGTIRTLAGGGTGDLAPGISLLDPIRLGSDADHRLFVTDAPSASVRALDAGCRVSPVAGTGTAGFSGDGYPATASQVNQPLGLAADISGDVYFADSANNRIRHLYRGEGKCDQPGSIFFDFSSPQTGSTVVGTLRLNCPLSQETTFALTSDPSGLQLPANIVIASGQSVATFTFELPPVTEATVFTVTATGGPYTATGTISVYPIQGTEAGWLTFSPSVQQGGRPVVGTLKLRNPAPNGGIQVSLSSDKPSVQVTSTVTVPAHQNAAEFLVTTSAVDERTNATITAAFGSNRITGGLTITRSNQGEISGLSLSAGTVVGGESLTGGVTLAVPAPTGGIEVELSSNNPAATLPAKITVPAGQTTGSFTIFTQAVSSSVDVLLTATSATSATATLTVKPSGAGGEGQIESLSLASSSLIGGQGTTGTVRLSAPAAVGGVMVNLRSNNPAVSVVPSLQIPEGQTSGTFAVTSATVTVPITASIVASSANNRSVDLEIHPGSGNMVNLGSLVMTPNPASGGQTVAGTVSLAMPAPAGGVHISLSSNHPFVTVPSSASAAEGQTAATFTITTSSSITSPVAATISASSGNTVNGVLNLDPAQPVQANIVGVALTSSMIVGGQGTTGTITLDTPAPLGGVRVNLTSSNASAVVDNSIIIPAGSLTATFSVSTSSVSAVTTSVITAASQNSRTVSLTINPISGGVGTLGSVTLGASTLVAGEGTVGTVTLVDPAPIGSGGIQVVLSSGHSGVVVPGSITIQEGETKNTFPVTTTGPAPGSPVTITATSANSVTTTLTVNPPQPVQAALNGVSLNPSTVVENGSSTGTVTLAAPAPAGGVRVDLTSSNGSVAAVAATSIIIPAGSSSGTFSVTTSHVTATTSVIISAQSANMQTATLTVNPITGATVTIGSLSVTPNPVSGGGTATGTVTLAASASAGGVSIPLSSNNANVHVPASLTIAAGSTSGTFSVSVNHVSSPITALITATSANQQSQTLTVNPAAPGSASIQGVTLATAALIGGGNTSGTVTLTAPAPANGVSVAISSNNSSALPGSTPIVIPGGATTGTFSIQTSTVASSVNVTITATSANSSTASLTVHPPSGPQVSIGSVTLANPTMTSGGSTTGTVTLAAPAPVTGVMIGLSSNNGAATVPSSVVIPSGQSTATFSVVTTPVAAITNVTISAQSANTVNAALTLNPPAPQQVTLSGVTLAAPTLEGGQGTTGTVTLAAVAPAGGATVTIASNNGIATVSTPVLIPAGQASGTFTVSTGSTASSVSITISATSANTVSTNLNLTQTGPSSGNIVGLALNANTLTGGNSTTATVTLAATAPIGGVNVTLSSNNAAASVPTSLTIPHGQLSRTFNVNTTAVSSAANITITAQSANSRTANLVVNPPCVESLTLSVGSILGGGTLNATVRLTGPAPVGGAPVQLLAVSGAAGFNNLPSTILVPEGQVEATVQLVTNPVAALLSTVLRAVFGPCPGITANLNIEMPILNGLAVPAQIKLLQSGTGTVTISGPAPIGGKVVSLSVLTSLPLGLNLGVPTSVTIPEGQTSANFQINVLGTLLGALNINVQASLDGINIVKSILLSLL